MDVVDQCCHLLAGPSSDLEKIQILLFAAQRTRGEDLDSESKLRLLRSIGAAFLGRMLLNELSISDEDGDLEDIARSAALSVVSALVTDPEVARNEQMLKLLPHILTVVDESDAGSTDLNEALLFLNCIARHDEGRRALISLRTLKHLPASNCLHLASIVVPIYIQNLSLNPSDQNTKRFNLLLSKMATSFVEDNSKSKFELCDLINTLLQAVGPGVPTMSIEQQWPDVIFKGLKDILTSRIDDEQRSPALNLASTMLKCFGRTSNLDDRRFHLLLFHLSSIEIRMQLEDRTFDQILKNSTLVVSCFTILEVAVTKFLDKTLDSKEQLQIVQSFEAAAAAVFGTLESLTECVLNSSHKTCVYAMIRFLSLGLSHDVLTLNPSVLKVLPFVLKIASDSFYDYQSWYNENHQNRLKCVEPVDVLALLLPALRQFVVLDKSRKLLLSRVSLLFDCLKFHWNSLENLPKHERPTDVSTNIVSIVFQIFIDCIVAEPSCVQNDYLPSKMFHFVVKVVSKSSEGGELQPILTSGSVLGLLIVKNLPQKLDENDSNIAQVVDGFVSWSQRYAEDNHSPDDNTSLADLGRRTLGYVVDRCPWLKERLTPQIVQQINLCREVA